jgi:hypothetical protein
VGQGVQADFVAQAGAERLGGAGGVVAAAVEQAVDAAWTRRRAGPDSAATARVAPATNQLGGLPATPPDSCPSTRTRPA